MSQMNSLCMYKTYIVTVRFPLYTYRIVGNIREFQHFAFFKGRAVNMKIKTVILPRIHALVFHTQRALGGCGFLKLKHEYSNPQTFILRALEPKLTAKLTAQN